MKKMKNVMALILAFAMVIGGIYFVGSDASVAKAETSTNVDEAMLNIKFQTAETPENDGTHVMRFITSVDSLDYSRVGFEVSYQDGNQTVTKKNETKSVFERIDSNVEGVDFEFSPKVVDETSEYFVTAKMYATKDVDYTVRAYVVTREGDKVYGPSRCISANDGLSTTTTTNATFKKTGTAAIAVGDVLTANGKDATVIAVTEDGLVHVRISVAPGTLPSATNFAFTANSAAVGSAIHRNLYTSHVPASGTTPVADTSWYTINPNATEFVVASAADLYGIAELANKTTGYETFAGKTIYLVSDIDLQPSGKDILWTPIGYMSSAAPRDITAFHGTFDGQMHKISHMKSASNSKSKHGGASWYLGFFGAASGATIKNFELIDGIVTGAYNSAAAVGCAKNTRLENVHTDVAVTMANGQVGGLVGNAEAVTMVSCWNEGAVTAGSNDYAGGFVGISSGATIEGCLNTGNVKTGVKVAGGFVGRTTGSLTISNSISTGTVTSANAERTGLGIGEQNGTAAQLLNWNEKSVIVVKNDSTLKAMGLNYGQVMVSNTGATLSASTCMTSVADNAAISGLLGYTATGLVFDRPETPDVQEGYWVVGNGIPELKCFSSSNNAALKGQFRKDTRWASVKTVETINGAEVDTYRIETAEDMLGFASLVNAGTRDFAGEVVYLENDIAYNTASKELATAWSNGTGTDDLFKGWTSIGYRKSGSDYKQFKGTFDGKMHTISGIYSVATHGNGLFGYSVATIKNLSLMDSYIQGGEGTGGIVGWYAEGTYHTLYSNAIVKAYSGASKNHAGGLFALTTGAATTVTNCWFDGEVIGAKYVGGMTSYNSTAVTFTDCLSTGTVKSTITTNSNSNYSHAGGFVGYAVANVTLVDCVEAGSVTGYGYTGTTIGLLKAGITFNATDFYFVGTMSAIGGASGTIIADGVTITATLASGATVNKNNPTTKVEDDTTAYGVNAYTAMSNLSYERTDLQSPTTGAWVARSGKIPALKSFVDVADRL